MEPDTIRTLILVLILIVVGGTYLGVSAETMSVIVDLFTKYVIIGAITSLVVGSLVEAFTGDYLKGILLNINIKGLKFSVSVFFITVVVLKLLIF
ncbi:MAG: hypothetical protein KAU24_01370 [Candidatus Aenigmarchaeota archaeon]|nr:hypothetical protein [Candidatus Aenigmarchaeota archaeon]